MDRQKDRRSDKLMDVGMVGWMDRWIHKQRARETKRKKDIEIERETDRQNRIFYVYINIYTSLRQEVSQLSIS